MCHLFLIGWTMKEVSMNKKKAAEATQTSNNIINIPTSYLTKVFAEYIHKPVWVGFAVISDGADKCKKLPVSSKTFNLAKINDPSTWGTFSEVVAVISNNNVPVSKYKPQHIGIALSEEEELLCIDLDDVRDPATGQVEQWARDMVEKCQSYTEISVSGKGLHIYGKGGKKSSKCRKGNIEIYSCKRFIILTGKPYNSCEFLANIEKPVDDICKEYGFEDEGCYSFSNKNSKFSDKEIISKACSATNGKKFINLFEKGDISGYGNDESAADQALCNLITFWTQDPLQVDRIFRQSALYREKWERVDYREATIDTSLQLVHSQTNKIEKKEESWSDPLPLPELPPVMPLTEEMLPPVIRQFIFDVAKRMQIPPDFAVMACITAVSSLIGRKVGIHPKRKDPWLVIPNLWGMAIASPSQLKTPAIKSILSIMEKLQQEARFEYEKASKEYDFLRQVDKQKKLHIEKEIQRNLDNEEELKILKEKYSEEKSLPILKRLITNDSTVEKVGEILRDNPQGILMYRDELSGWLKGLDEPPEKSRQFYASASVLCSYSFGLIYPRVECKRFLL
jgi:hypothetical protein